MMPSHRLVLLLFSLLSAQGEEIKLWGSTIDDDVLTEDSFQCHDGGLPRYDMGTDFCRRRFSPGSSPRATADSSAGTASAQLLMESNLCDCLHWHKLTLENPFSQRLGHATTSFNGKLWLVGGRSKEYSKWDLATSQRRADVWWTKNGKDWVQEKQLRGDFAEQNQDVLIPGPVAPWWERFGHSLNTWHAVKKASDGTINETYPEAMVLFGGYAPNPMNDLWVSLDGVTWSMVFKEPYYDTLYEKWPTNRANHGAAIFQERFWVLGGSPLNNEVWSAGNLTLAPALPEGAVDDGRPLWWTVKWTKHYTKVSYDLYDSTSVPWMPRAGLMVASQPVLKPDSDSGVYNRTIRGEFLYVMGGFAAWHETDFRYDGERARNDVWRTEDGTNWTRLDVLVPARGIAGVEYIETSSGGAPWGARAFGALTTWRIGSNTQHQPTGAQPYHDVTFRAFYDADYLYSTNKGLPHYGKRMLEIDLVMTPPPQSQKDFSVKQEEAEQIRKQFLQEGLYWAPRIWLSGGGYFGRSGNMDVLTMEAYSDLWWTRDGVEWFQVNNFAGSGETLYSSSESFFTEETAEPLYIGKYGHTMTPFQPSDSYIPAMFFVAGDMVDEGPLVNDVFQNSNGIFCDIFDPSTINNDGTFSQGTGFKTCSGHGVCAPLTPYTKVRNLWTFEKGEYAIENATTWIPGCHCDGGYTGEYCEGLDPDYYSGAFQISVERAGFALTLIVTVALAAEW